MIDMKPRIKGRWFHGKNGPIIKWQATNSALLNFYEDIENAIYIEMMYV